MITDLQSNPFAEFGPHTARQKTGVGVPSKSAISIQPLMSSPQGTKDEYISSAAKPADFYKRSSASVVPFDNDENTAQTKYEKAEEVMRKEMREGNGFHSFVGLISVAASDINKILNQVWDEKEVPYEIKNLIAFSISPDGIWIGEVDERKISELNISESDAAFAKEVAAAIEDAFNSSHLNMEENPHLFIKDVFPSFLDAAEWGIDPEEWSVLRLPDFSGFIKELRSDILDMFGDMEIMNFSLKIDDQGKLTVADVKTKGNNPAVNALTAEQINRGLTYEMQKKAEYLGLLILSVRQSTDGDVQTEGTILEPFDDGIKGNIPQFRKEIILTAAGYKVINAAEQHRHTV